MIDFAIGLYVLGFIFAGVVTGARGYFRETESGEYLSDVWVHYRQVGIVLGLWPLWAGYTIAKLFVVKKIEEEGAIPTEEMEELDTDRNTL